MLSVLVVTPAFADQKLTRKQIYELRQECKKRAADFARMWQLCDGTSSYQNHYNKKLNICFINMKALCDLGNDIDKHSWIETLTDVSNNNECGNYVGSGGLFDDKLAICKVGNIQCNNLSDFWKLLKPYMEE